MHEDHLTLNEDRPTLLTVVVRVIQNQEWQAIYAEILQDFGFDRRKDEEAMRIAIDIMKHKSIDSLIVQKELESRIKAKTAVICGNAPCLEPELKAKELDNSREHVIIAADGATSVLIRNAILPDVIVSDLDGYIPDIIYANRLGSILVVHAHGDNIEMLKKVLPALDSNVLCTAQCSPITPHGIRFDIYNFGGFTDGDRCVFLAKEFGTRRIELLGFDFDDTHVSAMKHKKLKWAKRLIMKHLKLEL